MAAFLRKDLRGLIYLCFSSAISAAIGFAIILIKLQTILNNKIIPKNLSLQVIRFSDNVDIISTGLFFIGVVLLTKNLTDVKANETPIPK